jgi:TRAP-type C4-dicarboxylate transport system permease small subunit
MKALSVLKAALKAFQRYVVMISGAVVCLLITISALMRYVFSVDFYGAEEIIMLLAFWLYFMGASLATREDSHITADLISSLIKTPRRKTMLKALQHAVSLAISVTVAYWAYNYIAWSLARWPKTPVLKLPVLCLQFPILLFFILSSFYILGHLIDDIRGLRDGKEAGR